MWHHDENVASSNIRNRNSVVLGHEYQSLRLGAVDLWIHPHQRTWLFVPLHSSTPDPFMKTNMETTCHAIVKLTTATLAEQPSPAHMDVTPDNEAAATMCMDPSFCSPADHVQHGDTNLPWGRPH